MATRKNGAAARLAVEGISSSLRAPSRLGAKKRHHHLPPLNRRLWRRQLEGAGGGCMFLTKEPSCCSVF